MNFDQIVELIERRRDALRDAASIGCASDPLVASAAQVAWERAEELDQLLAELKNSKGQG
jgi:Asp/Glu/hydantoin racemase